METIDKPEPTKLQLARTAAVLEATREVLGEQQAEIIRRAKAKLVAMGIVIEDDDGKNI